MDSYSFYDALHLFLSWLPLLLLVAGFAVVTRGTRRTAGLMTRSIPLVEANTEALRLNTAAAERLAAALDRANPAGQAGPVLSGPPSTGAL